MITNDDIYVLSVFQSTARKSLNQAKTALECLKNDPVSKDIVVLYMARSISDMAIVKSIYYNQYETMAQTYIDEAFAEYDRFTGILTACLLDKHLISSLFDRFEAFESAFSASGLNDPTDPI